MADVFVCRNGDLNNGDVRIMDLKGISVGLYRHADKYFAYRNFCVHQGGPVCEGVMMPKVEDVIAPDRTFVGQKFNDDEMHIVCPWHGYEFKLESGECAADPRLRLQRFKVVERDGGVYVAI